MCSRPSDDGSEPNSQASLNRYRLHLYNYALQAERLRLSATGWGAVCPVYPTAAAGALYAPRFPVTLFHPAGQNPDEPKPQHSYIGLIAMAILQSSEGKLVLSDIYQYILDNYPYFRTRGPGWRNSIRHNLSLNDCFVKAGRSANGKGHYWAIHPANVDDFKKGDFRRRKAQRKVRRHMGLAVDDDGNDSPSPPPPPSPTVAALSPAMWPSPPPPPPSIVPPAFFFPPRPMQSAAPTAAAKSQKRQFDVASLLAPDPPKKPKTATAAAAGSSSDEDEEPRTWEPSLLQRYYEQQLQAAHRLHAFRQTFGIQRMMGPWSGVIVDRNRTPTPPPQQQFTSADEDHIKTEIVD